MGNALQEQGKHEEAITAVIPHCLSILIMLRLITTWAMRSKNKQARGGNRGLHQSARHQS